MRQFDETTEQWFLHKNALSIVADFREKVSFFHHYEMLPLSLAVAWVTLIIAICSSVYIICFCFGKKMCIALLEVTTHFLPFSHNTTLTVIISIVDLTIVLTVSLLYCCPGTNAEMIKPNLRQRTLN